MALLWKSEGAVCVDSFSKNHINAVVSGGIVDAWSMLRMFTGFYSELEVSNREEAWSMLYMLKSKPHLPWCCMGDFNELLHMEEKRGGRLRPHAQMQAFQDILDFCGFMDLGFIGPEFTRHSRRHGHLIWECLDRGVTNYNWLAKFSTTIIRHLHCYSSNHRPISLTFNPNNETQHWSRHSFRFEEMWLAESGCSDTMLRVWQVDHQGTPMFKVTKKLKKCKKMLKSWSKEHFGSVKSQIAKKKELLWKVEETASKGGDYELVVTLRRELNILLNKESWMWR